MSTVYLTVYDELIPKQFFFGLTHVVFPESGVEDIDTVVSVLYYHPPFFLFFRTGRD